MSLDAAARPPTSVAPPVRAADHDAAIRSLLEEHRRARQDQVTAHAFADPHAHDLDPGARARALAAAELTLTEIEQALQRLDEGSYGLCTGCAEPIPAERLLVVPYARHCAPCS